LQPLAVTLTPGTRLGPYEVIGSLGAGGMGEVYRATDTNLDRQVAIKILPDLFAHDPDRLARFEREAKTLASLNHPNIAQIYGLEKGDGIRALVMELVEGPTLADRIAQGPIPIDVVAFRRLDRVHRRAPRRQHVVGDPSRRQRPARARRARSGRSLLVR
jgi:serine/threonine protein kinase